MKKDRGLFEQVRDGHVIYSYLDGVRYTPENKDEVKLLENSPGLLRLAGVFVFALCSGPLSLLINRQDEVDVDACLKTDIPWALIG